MAFTALDLRLVGILSRGMGLRDERTLLLSARGGDIRKILTYPLDEVWLTTNGLMGHDKLLCNSSLQPVPR